MFGECHAHLFMNGASYADAVKMHRDAPNENWIRQVFAAYREVGVTMIRDGGDRFGVSLRAKQIAPEYGIVYRTPIAALHKEGHYGHIVGYSFSNMKEYEQFVLRLRDEGADFIKIMTTGIMDFCTSTGLTDTPLLKEEVNAMVSIAHEHGLKVMSHTNGADAVITAVEAGVDSIEHGNFQNEESLRALATSECVWVPTCSTIYNLIGCGRFDDSVLRTIWENAVEAMQFARKIGVQIALGSDAGAFCVPHADGILAEYRRFKEIFADDDQLDQHLQDTENLIGNFSYEREQKYGVAGFICDTKS